MNTGQMLLAIAGFFLLGSLIINVNESNTERMLVSYNNETIIIASGLAQSIFDEIQMKAFDEKTANAPVSTTNGLTANNSLGRDAGEIKNTQYDDIDDYNDYQPIITLERMGDFHLKVSVFYVNTLNPQEKSSTQTFSKLIEIKLTNFSLLDTLKFDQIISY